MEGAFADLMSGIESCIKRTRNEESKRLLDLAKREAEEAYNYYQSDERDRGARAIHSSEEHFRLAVAGQPVRTTFIAGPAGVEKGGS
jgi:hypothetical protein